ncbi:class I SAM-dependent methyltransferase [Candidatus Parcubacteria bacterium]|nr:class I SAM-dependent methyltransferase [Patescibacteria group bacterium]MBU4309871.1 class I SAM-dependent methyltransferase [Patescibacteria group bacterium]MBU4431718.1 class I SAM-dependent methyltransferase [Patescibacteria group bacterium]MBU4578210.1 class I SAM-dependent methyltransferase [Patescibacteria group bacterium]MCG2696746.1 class I SAM-dependent methyltransferase [Candidatus Parcubacteria bacterium]
MDKNTQKELLTIVKDNYESIAAEFDETRKKGIWPELLNLTRDVKDGDKMLDAGCGNGRLLEAFAGKKIKYLGIDQSENLITLAQKQYPESEFAVADILDLGKINELDFDFVYSIAVLHHLPDQELRINALRQMKNKIKDDGRIIISAWNLWANKKNKKLIWKYFFLKLIGKNKMDFGDILFHWKNEAEDVSKKRYYHAFTKWELTRLVKKSGLKIEKLYKDEYNYYLVLKK